MNYKYIEEQVQLAKDKDNMAIINILNEFKPYCYTLISNTKIKNYDRQDLMQELQIKIVECIDRYNKKNKFVGYCTRSLKNHIYYLYRNNKSNNDISLTEIMDNKINIHYDSYNNFEYLNKLNELEKKVIILYYIEGNTLRKISDILEINYSKIVMVKNKTLLKIKKEIFPN